MRRHRDMTGRTAGGWNTVSSSVLWLCLLSALPGAAHAGGGIELSLPIACQLGRDCFIQQYADTDPGPGARDYRCGNASYDGHNGTDFRVLSLRAAAGVPVIAAADGQVKAVRDGMEDRLFTGDGAAAAVKGRECGNGAVLDHGSGWETQYCHMQRGSVKVRQGQTVSAGAMLGFVGASGKAAFAHVHLSVRRNGKDIDPFAGADDGGTCTASLPEMPAGLWAPGVRDALRYRGTTIIETGFTGDAVTAGQAELGEIPALASTSPAIVYYVRLINVEKGDSLHIEVSGPDGFHARSELPPLTEHKAHYIAFTGKKRRAGHWPGGHYQGRVEVLRGGQTVTSAESSFGLK